MKPLPLPTLAALSVLWGVLSAAAVPLLFTEENDPKPGQETASQSVSFHGPSYDDVRPHLWTFFQAVRTRQPVVEDAVFGNHAAVACHMANESYFRKSPVVWDPAAKNLKS